MAFHFLAECVGLGHERITLAPLYQLTDYHMNRKLLGSVGRQQADHLLNTQDSRVIVGLNMKGSAYSRGWTITITMNLMLLFLFIYFT